MRPISAPVKTQLANDPRMKLCAIRHVQGVGSCSGRVEWDHVWIYAGRQIDEPWAILGVCAGHHRVKEGDHAVKHAIQRESLLLATIGDLEKYPRKDWAQIARHLLVHVKPL